MREIVLSDSKHSELKLNYEKYQKQQKAWQEKLMKRTMKAQKKGEMSIPFEEVAKQTEKFEVDRKVRETVKDAFSKMVSNTFGKEYDLIIDEGLGQEIIFAKIPIPDLTAKFRQQLLELK